HGLVRLTSDLSVLKRQQRGAGRLRRSCQNQKRSPATCDHRVDPTVKPHHHASSVFPPALSNRSLQASPATRRGASRLGGRVETKTGRVQAGKHPLPPRPTFEKGDFQN